MGALESDHEFVLLSLACQLEARAGSVLGAHLRTGSGQIAICARNA